MARPNVYTYFDDGVSAPPNQCNFLRLWARSWHARGWNPRVLTVRNAQDHPAFAVFKHDSGEFPRLAAESAKVNLCEMQVLNFSYRPHKPSKFKVIVCPYLEEGWEIAPLVSFSNFQDTENCGRLL